MNFLTQLIGSMALDSLNFTFLVCVFGVVVFKPERIYKPSLFRFACLLFALSLIAPSLGMLLMSTATEEGSVSPDPFGEFPSGFKICILLRPLLSASAFVAVISSLLPTSTASSTAPQDGH